MAGKLMIGHVKFTVKAWPEQRNALRTAAEEVGIPWHEMLLIVEGAVGEACRQAADALVDEIARGWGPEEWQAGRVRYGGWTPSHNHSTIGNQTEATAVATAMSD